MNRIKTDKGLFEKVAELAEENLEKQNKCTECEDGKGKEHVFIDHCSYERVGFVY